MKFSIMVGNFWAVTPRATTVRIRAFDEIEKVLSSRLQPGETAQRSA